MKNEEIRNAAYQLAGLIYGISMDGIITKNEYEAMKSWCYENEPLCEMDSFQRLHSQIKPIIDDGKVNKEEIEELKDILNSFLEETGSINDKEPNLYFLNGIFKGILASGDVNTYEIYKLNQWLEKNEHLRKSTPFDELFSLIASVLEDKKVDDEEAIKLKAFFSAHLK
ncbi:hypothetical protein [Algoriphagus sp.]|uniref:hypothetical protein n=1 Tax=Algoriphagus sp. TaxID=1872435 RepID=UPI002716E8C8|nr:hypothetical protein [Algoriphagus sp.]MDO8966741.1 hypothetical protein [Algoriphagus sp.]MDP3199936.1 hypothetical protein [Algoriphagus sp.]